MKRPAIVLLLTFCLMVPIAQAVTIDGPTIFQGPHGGYVFYDPATTTSNIGILNGIWRLTGLTIGGNNRGALGFDISAGDNMTVLGVSRYEIRYQVNSTGAATQYIYYANNDHAPIGTNTDNIAYDAVTNIATVTTTGNVIVTLDYANISGLGISGLELFLNLFPIVAFFAAIEARKRDMLSNTIVVMILVFAVAAFIVLTIRSAGF